MATVNIDQLLHTISITRVISELKASGTRFQSTYGTGVGGATTERQQGYTFAWDIFNQTRRMAQGRPPNSGPGSASRQAVGQATAVAHRLHEKIPLLDNELFRHRAVGQPVGTVDRYGANYVMRQAGYMAQRIANAREFMTSRMLCGGSFALNPWGDSRILADSASGGGVTVDFQIPAQNLTDVDDGSTVGAVFAGNWQLPSTADPVDEIYKLQARAAKQTGYAIRHMWCSSKVWGYLQNNDILQALAGSANRVFEDLTPMPGDGRSSIDTGFTARLTAIPWLTIHITDEVFDLSPVGADLPTGPTTSATAIPDPDTSALFTPDPDPSWIGYIEGSEVVRVNKTAAPVERFGFTAWSEPTTQPSGRDLITLDVGLPVLYVPHAVFYATVAA